MALTAVQVLAKFADFLESFEEFREAGGFKELHKTAPKGKTAPKSAPAEDVEEDDEQSIPSAEEAAKLPVVELRKLAVALGLEEQKVKAGILAELDEMRAESDDDDADDEDEEFEDEDDEPADDSDDEGEDDGDDEEDEPYTREELEGMSLKELRAIAKSEGVSAAEYRGADVDKLVDLIVGLDDEGDEDEDEDDEVEDDVVEITEDAVRKMNVADLLKLADDLGVAVPRRVKAEKSAAKKKSALVDLIMDSAEEEDEDDE